MSLGVKRTTMLGAIEHPADVKVTIVEQPGRSIEIRVSKSGKAIYIAELFHVFEEGIENNKPLRHNVYLKKKSGRSYVYRK